MELRSRLRRATQSEHRKLEDALDLMARPLSKWRFLHALCRFHGFHSVWEAAIRRHAGLAAVLDGRDKLCWVRSDLEALGCSPAEINALPTCMEAEMLVSNDARAAGSLYVIEGSSLGGQVISRALSTVTWTPPGGLRYFAPYGANTEQRWRDFLAWLEMRSSPQTDPDIEAGAVETFEVLRGWMAPRAAP